MFTSVNVVPKYQQDSTDSIILGGITSPPTSRLHEAADVLASSVVHYVDSFSWSVHQLYTGNTSVFRSLNKNVVPKYQQDSRERIILGGITSPPTSKSAAARDRNNVPKYQQVSTSRMTLGGITTPPTSRSATARDRMRKGANTFTPLCEAFGERRNGAQLLRKFYSHKQREGEDLLKFSHALSQSLSKVVKRAPDVVSHMKLLLRDHFMEGVRGRVLRRYVRAGPSSSLVEAHEEAYLGSGEEPSISSRVSKSRGKSTEQGEMTQCAMGSAHKDQPCTLEDVVLVVSDNIEKCCIRKIWLQSDSKMDRVHDLFTYLQEAFGERRNGAQLLRKFYSHKQREGEDLLKFSHALSQSLSKVVKRAPDVVSHMKLLLRDHFMEGVRGRVLRRYVRAGPSSSLVEAHEEAYLGSGEEPSISSRVSKSRGKSTEQGEMTQCAMGSAHKDQPCTLEDVVLVVSE
ncbi:hypothetical protein P4O66_003679 [Electrophorus voltai]|uniref:Uncharacterized protein n=1 Tax=Electrophorus voltai TaxID=2609070 RepID=A0AAD9E2N5_9TELE|nr:hypothetical protein P4O66_003679 [Electrophorus voltai]